MKDSKSPNHVVTVHINEKPVDLSGPRVTGLEIKQAALQAELPVELDFVLSEERPSGPLRNIGDNDEVTVNKQSRFLLVAPDDNS